MLQKRGIYLGKVPTVISLASIVQTSLYNQTIVLRIPVLRSEDFNLIGRLLEFEFLSYQTHPLALAVELLCTSGP